MSTTIAPSFFIEIGDLKRFGEKGVNINIEKILQKAKENFTFHKDAENALEERIREEFLPKEIKAEARKLLDKLYGKT